MNYLPLRKSVASQTVTEWPVEINFSLMEVIRRLAGMP